MYAAIPVETAGHPGLVRPRLLDDLDRLRTARLAVVVAPAGAGKTTLLAQYAAQWAGRSASGGSMPDLNLSRGCVTGRWT